MLDTIRKPYLINKITNYLIIKIYLLGKMLKEYQLIKCINK
jgi:hypothetical protein